MAASEDLSSGFTVSPEKAAFYRAHGWVVLEDVVPASEVARLKRAADDMISGLINPRSNIADLGGHADRVKADVPNIYQIAWPTDLSSKCEREWRE